MSSSPALPPPLLLFGFFSGIAKQMGVMGTQVIKKNNLWQIKIMLNVEWNSLKFMKNDLLMVKASLFFDINIKKQEIKQLAAVSYIHFFKKYLQNLKHNVKRACIFHLILVGIVSSLSIKNGAGFFLPNRQNQLALNMTFAKYICLWSQS